MFQKFFSSTPEIQSGNDDMIVEVLEHERFSNNGWAQKNLKDIDPPAFLYGDGKQSSSKFPTNIELADGWEFVGKWYSVYPMETIMTSYFTKFIGK